MRQQENSAQPQAILHRGMVPVVRSRTRDELFEVHTILGILEHRHALGKHALIAEAEALRTKAQRLETELPDLPLEGALAQAEILRVTAAELYARSMRD
jgi:hypothetical protein